MKYTLNCVSLELNTVLFCCQSCSIVVNNWHLHIFCKTVSLGKGEILPLNHLLHVTRTYKMHL